MARRAAIALSALLLLAGAYALWADPAEQYGLACCVAPLVGLLAYLLTPARGRP
ncbi:MAG: hypothetical protein KBA95_15515 [Acidobacteria bacterium]|nr:hypothetical protein [Acidobacteriota bacterium]